MGLFKTAREVKKFDKEAEEITGYKLNPISPPPDQVYNYFDAYVKARREGFSKPKAAKLASKESGLRRLKKVS
jgi:hypothetical protein